MNTRSLLIAGLAASLCLLGPTVPEAGAAAAAANPQSVAPTQEFTGGGTGAMSERLYPTLEHTGEYTSTGQLGQGLFKVEDENPQVLRPAHFTRSDGMTLSGTSEDSPGECGAIPFGAFCLTLDLDGTADIAHAHIQLVGYNDFGSPSRPETTAFLMRGTLTMNHRIGYAMADANGSVYAFGGVDHVADANSAGTVDVELTPSGMGYWIVNRAGAVYAFGDARAFNSGDPATLPGDIAAMSATPTGKGYWLFTSTGRALPFGDAKFFGDLGTTKLNGPIVGSIATPTGNGYYMVGSDGGVFAFGDARFRGSMGGVRLNQPVVGIVPTAANAGYWLVAADGGVFSFNAPFLGSMGGTRLNRPVVAIVRYGAGYLMVASDGGVFDFSDAPFFGSEGGARVPVAVVAAAATG